MTKLEIFILFPVGYLKEILTTKTNKLLTDPMDLGECIRWFGCWFYMGCWVKISNWRNRWSTENPKMFEGVPFRINKYMSSTRFEGIILSLHYTDRKDVEYDDGLFHMWQMEK